MFNVGGGGFFGERGEAGKWIVCEVNDEEDVSNGGV
jgi:hypothetical protein